MAKILLVEDDKGLREIYGVRLQAEGYQIVSAGDGEEALAIAIKERPDLIVSDVMMPKISGFDMLDILRSTTETKDIKVIMMTALSSEDQRARGESLGADRYLVKSQVGIEDVVRTVHDVLGDGVATSGPAPSPFAAPIPTAAIPTTPAPAPAPFAAPAEPLVASTPAPVAPTPAPLEPIQPIAAPQLQTPVASAPVTEPAAPFAEPAPFVASLTPTSTPAPITPTPVAVPTPAPTPVPPMPQPTAPFSTNRPGSTATISDRVINPLVSPESLQRPTNISDLMNQELGITTPTQPVVPTDPSVPPTPGA